LDANINWDHSVEIRTSIEKARTAFVRMKNILTVTAVNENSSITMLRDIDPFVYASLRTVGTEKSNEYLVQRE